MPAVQGTAPRALRRSGRGGVRDRHGFYRTRRIPSSRIPRSVQAIYGSRPSDTEPKGSVKECWAQPGRSAPRCTPFHQKEPNEVRDGTRETGYDMSMF